MPSRSIDFLVVGGGPAGCAFAILAARAGASVALVERDDYSRPRPGEHLAGRVRPMLDALRVPKEEARSIAALSPGILSLWSGDESLAKLYGATGQATGLCVVRHRFDELMCRSACAAGAMVTLLGRPTHVERLPTREWDVTIADARRRTQRIIARSVVDASGRRASIARRLGAHRIKHGDLVAIVRWLDVGEFTQSVGTMLTIESCAYGWWSLSAVAERTLVATFYTSADLWRSARVTAGDWWARALGTTERIAQVVDDCRAKVRATHVYPACPSRSSHLFGDGWITIGDAAVAFDPVAGQGVTLAMETAFRAFEAARVDPSWAMLGADYSDALLSRYQTHLDGRARVYAEAAGVLSQSFLRSTVTATADHSSAPPVYAGAR
jgi:flavin-dependent dehydrogenase